MDENGLTEQSLEERLRELKRDFAHLEKRFDSTDKLFRVAVSVIGFVFVAVSFSVGLFSFSSKQDVEKAIDRMETRFDVLAGESLRRANLEILHQGESTQEGIVTIETQLERSTVPWHPEDEDVWGPDSLGDLVGFRLALGESFVVTNSGDKAGTITSMALHLSIQPDQCEFEGFDWEQEPGTLEGYPTLLRPDFHSLPMPALSPGDTWSLPFLDVFLSKSVQPPEVKGIIQIFYGGDSPAEANILIRLQGQD